MARGRDDPVLGWPGERAHRGDPPGREPMTAADESRDAAERQRIVAEYRRREREVDGRVYAPWNPSAIYARAGRSRAAALSLARLGVFPNPGDACLELGF